MAVERRRPCQQREGVQIWALPAAGVLVLELPAAGVLVWELPATGVLVWELPAARVLVWELPAAGVLVWELPAAGVLVWELPAAGVLVWELPAVYYHSNQCLLQRLCNCKFVSTIYSLIENVTSLSSIGSYFGSLCSEPYLLMLTVRSFNNISDTNQHFQLFRKF